MTTGKELEVKFYLADLPALQRRLEACGAQLVQPRVHEINLRFDTPNQALQRSFQVLRLRQDAAAHLTYKGPGVINAGVRERVELEVTVSDFAATQALLEALGYQVSVMYEKYRATYDLAADLHVTLDEMPYGHFAEIEGPDGATIQAAAGQLGLDWERRNLDSYLVLFDRVRLALGLTCQHLSFAAFTGITVPATALGVEPADRPGVSH
jgi:adenylate cyclase class 2